MKKKTAIQILAVVLCLCLLAGCGGGAKPAKESTATAAAPVKIGMLSMLNSEKEKATAVERARSMANDQLVKEGYCTLLVPGLSGASFTACYYDTLETMLMGLNAGEILAMQTYQTIANYLCAVNDGITVAQKYDLEKERNAFAEATLGGILSNDFSFLLMEDRTALRDEFDAAIDAMKQDGTLDRLVKEQIDAVIGGGVIQAVTLEHFDGAETVKVAVTGALPPMDYATPDGMPAGFSTAVLAEVGRRMEKNIALIVVDSIGRAAALASGTVDVVFWTRTNSESIAFARMTEKERDAYRRQLYAAMDVEEEAVLKKMENCVDYAEYGRLDAPDGTIMTAPYFSDIIVPVVTKAFAASGGA